MIIINFVDNPGAISKAKTEIMRLKKNVNPHVEGVFLQIHIPRMTREARQNLIKTADKNVYNAYKDSINSVCFLFNLKLKYFRYMQSLIRFVNNMAKWMKGND